MKRQKEIDTVKENRLNTALRGNANISVQYARNREKILDTLAEIE